MDIYGDKLVNAIETSKPLCISSSNLTEMLILVRGWTLLILKVRSKVKVTVNTYGNKL